MDDAAPAAPSTPDLVTVEVEIPAKLVQPLIEALKAAEMTAIRRGVLGPRRVTE